MNAKLYFTNLFDPRGVKHEKVTVTKVSCLLENMAVDHEFCDEDDKLYDDGNEDERLGSNPLVKSAVRAGAVWQD